MVEYLEVGQIVNTNGLKGVMKVNPFTSDITRFDKLKSVYVDYKKEMIVFEIENVRYQKGQVYMKIKGIDDISEAEKYKECYLKIDRKDAVKVPKDTYFIVDLLGIDVYDINDNLIGKLDDIFPTGSNDVYVIKNNLGEQILLPAISKVIKKIDLENKKMIVEIIEGLL